MKKLVLSLTGKLCLAVFSILLGMVGYVLASQVKGLHTDPALVIPSSAPPKTGNQVLSIDAAPTLLALTQNPIDLCSDALGVLYVLGRNGSITRVGSRDSNLAVSTQYAALGNASIDERIGFSSIAFHPGFLVKDHPGFGKFYAVVSERSNSGRPDFVPEFGPTGESHQDVVYEFTTPHPLAATFDGTQREVVRFSQPAVTNNLQSLVFDHLGHLYLAVGDGASDQVSTDSPSKNASSLTSAYGKVLRIDPLGRNSANGNYGIPELNPFQLVTDAIPELWAFGLRAPHSLHYDPYFQSLSIPESAINGLEKVNVSRFGGEHFGWDLTEGSLFATMTIRSQLEEIVTDPAIAIDRSWGGMAHSTGSLVYRGENFPSLVGKLILASHDGQLLACSPSSGDGQEPEIQQIDLGDLRFKTFAALRSTPQGELVVLCEDGSVYELKKGNTAGNSEESGSQLYCLSPRVDSNRS